MCKTVSLAMKGTQYSPNPLGLSQLLQSIYLPKPSHDSDYPSQHSMYAVK